ncbi:T9SS type B sorting domain-containing protein [Flavobacterium sp. LT1R49]|uniref:T9SS type B sorting domain-containing protein n=1 Tax=Flavobacterium arabinosi TaxID=3398737 RepID=UPI003A844FA5
MEKLIKSFVFIFLITILSNISLYAKNRGISHERKNVGIDISYLVPSFESIYIYDAVLKKRNLINIDPNPNSVASPPTVTTPVYYCQNSVAVPLTATTSAGGTLNWYGTNATGGILSSTAPTPSTATLGATSYYVSETVGGIESTRSKIDVIVVADNGAVILLFRCDPSQVLPADKNSSVMFDWANNPLINNNSYNYSYSIQGGPIVTGNTTLSHQQVFGMLPGQSATLTLSAATFPCVPSQTITCSVPCGSSTVIPNFPAIVPFCSGTVAPILPATSPNGITGTWSPAIINNTTSGSYVFTPNPILFPCATTQTLPVTVVPLATPTFTTIPSTVCQNATAPILPTSSTNSPAITGTWSPATVNTAVLGPVTYTFTPNAGQCVSALLTTASINIVPVVTPNFATIPPFCSGTTAPLLSSTSPNGIVGTWSPSIVSNTTSRNYLFTPNTNQCATTQTLSVVVTPKTTPNFAAIPAFCTGTTAPILASTSPNGISGTWSPATINNTTSGSYVFTPNATQCATTQTLTVTVNPLIQPNFIDLSICSGTTVPLLSNTSPNGITGTWSPAIINNITSGAYVFTPNPNQCATSKSINVTVNQSTLVSVDWTVTEAFSKNQIVTISATATGGYLYQLDDGPFQESPVFEYVSLGTHSITVQDKNGCGFPITRNNVLVIDYPKFFTPNNDTYNDTWNIFSLQDQTSSKILIFDRYGKFLKEIRPSGLGWDGTYIGQPMPANDYWFTVEYIEQDIPKKFKSHFSLKR